MSTRRPNFAEQKEAIAGFLLKFQDRRRHKKYINMIQEAVNRERTTIDIELDDVATAEGGDILVRDISKNTMRYVTLFADAIDSENMPKADPQRVFDTDAIDAAIESRERMQEVFNRDDTTVTADKNSYIPKELLRRYEVRIIPPSNQKLQAIRTIGADCVGGLHKCRGIVTRVTEVRPLMRVAVYVCDICGNEVYQTVNKKRYIPVVACPSDECQRNRNKKPLLPQSRGCKFVKFQEIKLQESPEEVPEGNVPRAITIYAMGECTRQCTCGDKITVSGVWLPLPHVGFQALRAGLTTNTYLHAMQIIKEKKGYTEEEQDAAAMRKADEISEDPQAYSKLARSLAPEIYGLEDVKKALLLVLVGAVTKTMGDGLKIRGDINVLLMGDPGVAKSQLLKHIVTVAPRAVYTTGKGSSGVGLTAAVIRDPLTRDMTLEGGALVLSDMGICCIDEFDKMEESDRTAIHEVMEQQTISIAKAGITTTLNARTAILAAANPAYGRYDKKRSPEANINLPAALLSRFDLLFVLVDQPSIDADMALARHITHVHQKGEHPALEFEPYEPSVIRAYITKARQYEPVVPRHLTEHIVACYVQMRKASLDTDGQYNSKKIVGTPRALLSILRLAQGMARIRFDNEVKQQDVQEAIRLIQEAKRSTLADEEIERENMDPVSRIYDIVIEYLKARNETECRLAELKTMLTTRGFTGDQITETIEIYEQNDVWMVGSDGQTLSLV